MKSSSRPQSATSLPSAPRDDEARRSSRYLVMMGIRIACFVLMVLITPYGWYTWVLGAAAIVLPYIAVVLANVSANVRRTGAENPEPALPAVPSAAPSDTPIVRIEETHALEERRDESDGPA